MSICGYAKLHMEKYIMALDQGTTSSRCILFNKKGEIIAQANQEFTQIFPKPGWVKHDPEEIWLTQLLSIRKVMNMAGVSGNNIEAIGITNQRETTIHAHKGASECARSSCRRACRGWPGARCLEGKVAPRR